jgi:hypothetical protein
MSKPTEDDTIQQDYENPLEEIKKDNIKAAKKQKSKSNWNSGQAAN